MKLRAVCILISLFLNFETSHWALTAETTEKEITGFSFNPLSVKRDPFMPPLNWQDSDLKEIQKYDINQMNLVAILTGMGKPQAMIVLPNGKTEIISKGDAIGRRNGQVSEITPTQVRIKESFRDYQNRVKTDITTLEIAE